MNSEQPIGFFDSGIGGLTVANSVLEALPNERIVYFADSLHFPYGEKLEEDIQAYSLRIADFLLSKQCKCIVIACNSASASAYNQVKKYVGNRAMVVDVISPTVYYIEKYLNHISTIGVIATRRTIKSQAYKKRILASNASLTVKSLATPLLAPMVEEGFVNDEVSKAVLSKYLHREELSNIEAIILACTHYPFLKQDILAFYENQVAVIDTPTVVTAYLEDKLKEKNLLSKSKESFEEHEFYASELNETIDKNSDIFFTKRFQLNELNIF